ncbi:MAG: carboxymuconolactone decarboxylase family protein [Actinomycetota bacterium]
MARIDIPDGEELERIRLLMMQPDIAIGMGSYASAVYEKSSLPARIREIARLRIASANGCPVCLNTRSPNATADGLDENLVDTVVTCAVGAVAELEDLTEREQLAGEFADRFATDHHRIDDAFMAQLRQAFTDVEIIELTATCAMTLGNGRFLTVLGVEADDDGHYLLTEADT